MKYIYTINLFIMKFVVRLVIMLIVFMHDHPMMRFVK